MESDYRLAIELIENAHALITGSDWRDEELRKVLARTIDLLEEVQHRAPQPHSAVIIDLQRRAMELGRSPGMGRG
jgi:hypothetical protein